MRTFAEFQCLGHVRITIVPLAPKPNQAPARLIYKFPDQVLEAGCKDANIILLVEYSLPKHRQLRITSAFAACGAGNVVQKSVNNVDAQVVRRPPRLEPHHLECAVRKRLVVREAEVVVEEGLEQRRVRQVAGHTQGA